MPELRSTEPALKPGDRPSAALPERPFAKSIDFAAPSVERPAAKAPERAASASLEKPAPAAKSAASALEAASIEAPATLKKDAKPRDEKNEKKEERKPAKPREWTFPPAKKEGSWIRKTFAGLLLLALAGGSYYAYEKYEERVEPSADDEVAGTPVDTAPPAIEREEVPLDGDPFADEPAPAPLNRKTPPAVARHQPNTKPIESAPKPARRVPVESDLLIDPDDPLAAIPDEPEDKSEVDPAELAEERPKPAQLPRLSIAPAKRDEQPAPRAATPRPTAGKTKAAHLLEDDEEYVLDEKPVRLNGRPEVKGPKISVVDVQDQPDELDLSDEGDVHTRSAAATTRVVRSAGAAGSAADSAGDDWIEDERPKVRRNAGETRASSGPLDDEEGPVSVIKPRAGRTPPAAPARLPRGSIEPGGAASPRSTSEVRGATPASRPTTRSESYTVVPGDNFWNISRKQYGTPRYFAALTRHNQQVVSDPQRLRPGMQIATPPAAVLEQRYPELIDKSSPAPTRPSDDVDGEFPTFGKTHTARSPEREPAAAPAAPGIFYDKAGVPYYRIGEGDTMSGIASRHLGRSSRWTEIYDLNRKDLNNPETLTVGTVIRLPGDASTQLSRVPSGRTTIK